jgi:hypothetical protein
MILVHGTPRQFRPLVDIGKQLNSNVLRVSDHRVGGDIWLMESVYRLLDDPSLTARVSYPLDETKVANIMLRCRFLRIIDSHLAYRLILAGIVAFEEIFDRHPISHVLSRPVDYYLNDILMRVARHRNIPVMAFSESPGMGLTLVQGMGEWQPVREPEPDEVERTIQQWLVKGHFSDYVVLGSQNIVDHAKRVAVYRLRDAYRFLQKVATGDPLNMHYSISKFRATPRSLWDFPFNVKFATSIPPRSKRPVLLWLLGRTPEATTDYLCPGFAQLDFQRFVVGTARALAEHFDVSVKDHLDIVGVRDPKMYRTLQEIKGLTVVDPRIPATRLYDGADVVLIATGTTGLEALAYGKPVVRFGHNYWTSKENSLYVSPQRLLEGTLVPTMIRFDPEYHRRWARAAVHRMLAASIPGNFMFPQLSVAERQRDIVKAMPYIDRMYRDKNLLRPILFPEEFDKREEDENPSRLVDASVRLNSRANRLPEP